MEDGSNAFTLDFCLSTSGVVEAECLADIVYGRLKIEDPESGKSLILSLEMLPGKLEYEAITHTFTPELSDEKIEILENLMVESFIDFDEDVKENQGLKVIFETNGKVNLEIQIEPSETQIY